MLRYATLEMVKLFIGMYGLPIEQMFEGKNKFKATNYLYGVMANLKDQYPVELREITVYRDKILEKEVEAVGAMAGSVPIRRGRLTFLGKGRAGKSSTIRALRGEAFDAVSKSTVVIDINDAIVSVRDVGTAVSDIVVSGKDCWAEIPTTEPMENNAIKMWVLNPDSKETPSKPDVKEESQTYLKVDAELLDQTPVPTSTGAISGRHLRDSGQSDSNPGNEIAQKAREFCEGVCVGSTTRSSGSTESDTKCSLIMYSESDQYLTHFLSPLRNR